MTKDVDNRTAGRLPRSRRPIMLYNLAEAAKRTGLPRRSIVKLCTNGKAPRHYLTGDKIDIYFDERSLKILSAAKSASGKTN